MRIAIIGSSSFDSLEFHLKDELIFEGHDCEIFGFDKVFSRKIDMGLSLASISFVERKNKKLLNRLLLWKPDIIIGVYRDIHPMIVKSIKKEKIKIIHLNPDQLTTFQNQQLFAEPYDKYFVKDPYIQNFMKYKLGLNVSLYTEAFNPRYHKTPGMDFELLEMEADIDLLCFGNLYPYRNRMLHILKQGGINITIYGHKAKYFDSYLNENFKNKGIYGGEKSKILSGAKIVFNNLHYAEIGSVNNKFFEINGSGAFQLCDYKPILHELLPIDPELVSFKTIGEAESLIKHYLINPTERWAIREKVHAHFLANHTYKNLVVQLLSNL